MDQTQNTNDVMQAAFRALQNIIEDSEEKSNSTGTLCQEENFQFGGTNENLLISSNNEQRYVHPYENLNHDPPIPPIMTSNFSSDKEKEDLLYLLGTWKQEQLLDHLLAEKVFVDVLKVIKRHHIPKLLEKFDFGTQILFENNLEQWRNLIGMPLDYGAPISSLPSGPIGNPPSPASSFSGTSSSRPGPYERSSTPEENKIMLSDVLNETPKGMMLAEYYNKFSRFDDDQRASLIGAIARFFEEKNVPLTLATSYRLEREILERFPNEKLEYYRTSKRGKIYNKFSNLKSSFKSAVTQHLASPKSKTKTEKKSRCDKTLVPETDAESCVRSLKYDNLTSEEFDNCWKACAQHRLSKIKELDSTAEILQEWPYYKKPSGFRLIDMDFNTLYEKGNGLLDEWNSSFNKILSFLHGHVKDKHIKTLLEEVKNDKVDENSRDAIILWAIHGYLVPTHHKVVRKDPLTGKKNTIRFTIKDSQESFIFVGKCHQEIEEHLRHVKSVKESIQPFILAIGEDISNLKELYVYFDDLKFSFTNFLRAVDICFKTNYLFNLNFPIESSMFWNFIECYFFQMKTKESFSKVHIFIEALKSDGLDAATSA